MCVWKEVAEIRDFETRLRHFYLVNDPVRASASLRVERIDTKARATVEIIETRAKVESKRYFRSQKEFNELLTKKYGCGLHAATFQVPTLRPW